jgi:hypothetical protein
VADAVLYEGYVLYPYRASAQKNRVRWQFGVLAPRAWSEAGGCEPWWMQTECLVEPDGTTRIGGTVRFLQVQARRIERARDPDGVAFDPVATLAVNDRLLTAWEEGVEREVPFEIAPTDDPDALAPRVFPRWEETEVVHDADGRVAARIVRERRAIEVAVRVTTEDLPGPPALRRVRIRVENQSPCCAAPSAREDALGSFLVGTHTLLEAGSGRFLSLLDPPPAARDAAAACENVRTWPVLVGTADDARVVLSSPIILPDHPEIAPESPGDLCDATEIDEILTLRTMTLTDEEKREARATDPRAAAIIDRADAMPPEVLDRLHGAIRSLRQVTGEAADATPLAPWWDPGADASVSPETDWIAVGGVTVARGSRVRLRPGVRRTDAQDLFLTGRTARVEGVFFDVEDRHYLAVSLEDDPAAELQRWHGRYLYFAPDEVEPLEEHT